MVGGEGVQHIEQLKALPQGGAVCRGDGQWQWGAGRWAGGPRWVQTEGNAAREPARLGGMLLQPAKPSPDIPAACVPLHHSMLARQPASPPARRLPAAAAAG